jgi:hypothetical protein
MCAALALLLSAAFADAASASPVWKLNGVPLTGSETTLGHAGQGSLVIPGLTVTCEPFVYGMTISNVAGTGKGSVTEVPLKSCFTSSKSCAVEKIEAEKLPWSATLKTVGTNGYLVIEGLKISILFQGEECALGGTLAVIKGSAGGRYENATESVTFNSASFTATGASLKALGGSAELNGTFAMLATGPGLGESLTVS